jgi:hypothetical protein
LVNNNKQDLAYASDMMLEVEPLIEGRKSNNTGEKGCLHYNLASHQHVSSRLVCPKNKSNLAKEVTAVEEQNCTKVRATLK